MTTNNNIYKPTRLKVNRLGIDISNETNNTLSLSSTEYLVVGEHNTINTKTYSLIVDSDGIAINSTREKRLETKTNGCVPLEVYGKTYIEGTLNVKGAIYFIDENGTSNSIGTGTTGGSTIAASYWQPASNATGDTAIYYSGNITVGPYNDSVRNPYTINVVDEALSINDAQFAIQNKYASMLRIGIIGTQSNSPVVFNTLNKSPIQFHVGRRDTDMSLSPNLNIDENGNVGIHNSLNYDINFRKLLKVGINTDSPVFADVTEKPVLHSEGTSYFKDILMLDYETSEPKHLDELYVRRLGITFDASNVVPGVFKKGAFTFTSNLYITNESDSTIAEERISIDSNTLLYVNGDIHTPSNVIVDGTLTANLAILTDNVSFSNNVYVQNNVYFKGALFKQRGNELDEYGEPIYDMLQFGTSSFTRNNNGIMTADYTNVKDYTADSASEWVRHTIPDEANNQWRCVIWASNVNGTKGLFVAVASTGEGNRVMTSTNGIEWVLQTSAADNEWNSVTWSPELALFVAVASSGIDNRVMTSSDGITWVTRKSAANNDWRSVIWASGAPSTNNIGLFVAVASSGDGDRVMTSEDGITWVTQESAADNDWQSITWRPSYTPDKPGIFVAVANTGTQVDSNDPNLENRVMTSEKGILWVVKSAPNNNWTSVIWAPGLGKDKSPGLFVAVASSGTFGRVMTSNDGIAWTPQESPTNNWTSVVFANKSVTAMNDGQLVTTNEYLLVAVSWTGEGDRVMTSKDGKSWVTQKSIIDYNWSSIAWSPELDLFAAVSISNSITNIYPLGEGFGTPGRGVFGLDPNNIKDEDENNHQVVIIKRDLRRFELELTDKSDRFYKRTAFIGHPRVSEDFLEDGSLVFLTSEQAYGKDSNLMYKNRSQNFYFYPKGNNLPNSVGNVSQVNPANFEINKTNPPALGVFPKKIGVNTFDPKYELHVEGSIFVTGKYYYKRSASDIDGTEIGFWNARTNLGISYSNPIAPYVGINENPNSSYSLTVRGNIRSDGYYIRNGATDLKVLPFYDGNVFTNIANVPYTNAFTNGRMGIGVTTSDSTLHIKDSSNSTSLKLSQSINSNKSVSLLFNGEAVDYSWNLNENGEYKVFELNYGSNNNIKPFITRHHNESNQIIINSNIAFTESLPDTALLVKGDVHIEGSINVTGGYKFGGQDITLTALNVNGTSGERVGFSTTSTTNSIYILGNNVYIDPTRTLYIGLTTGEPALDNKAMLYVNNKDTTSIVAASYNTSTNACMSKYTTTNNKSVLIGLTDSNTFFVGKDQTTPYIVARHNTFNSVGIGVTDPDNSALNVVTTSQTQSVAKFTRRLNVGGADEPADISLEKVTNTGIARAWKMQGPNSIYNEKLQFIYEEHTNNISKEVVCITKDGHMGIGTSNPQFAIDIQNMGESGSIRMIQEPSIQKDSIEIQANPFFIDNETIEISNDWRITTGWRVRASSQGHNAYKAFDNDNGGTTSYESDRVFDSASGVIMADEEVNIGLSYPYPVILKSITFANITDILRLPHTWDIQWSSNNVDWHTHQTFTDYEWEPNVNSVTISLTPNVTTPYNYWRINVRKIGTDSTTISSNSVLINSLIFNTNPITTSRPQLIFQTGLGDVGNDVYTDYCLYASDNSFTIDSRNTTVDTKMLLNFNSTGNIGIRTSASDNYNVSINGTLNVSDNIFIQGRSLFNTRDPSGAILMAFITWDSISILPTVTAEVYGGVIINGQENTSNVFQVNSGNNGNVAVFNSTRTKSYVHLRSTNTNTGIIWRYGLNMENPSNLSPHPNTNNPNVFINEFKIASENIPEFIEDDSDGYVRANELVIIKEAESSIVTKDLLQITYGSIHIKKFPYTDGSANYDSGNGYVEGNFEVRGYLINTSDRRIKNDILPIEHALEKIKKLSGYTFTKGNTDKRETGVIAQEVAEVLPEAVFETNDGILGVAYGNLAGILIEGIKELSQQIEEIKRRLQ